MKTPTGARPHSVTGHHIIKEKFGALKPTEQKRKAIKAMKEAESNKRKDLRP